MTFGAQHARNVARWLRSTDEPFDEFDSDEEAGREYVRMPGSEDIEAASDPIDEAIKRPSALLKRRFDDRLRRIRGAMWLKVRTSELASRVGTV